MAQHRVDRTSDAASETQGRDSKLPRGLSAFSHRNYRLFFAGQLVSVTGTWMQAIAQAWLVLGLTNSPFQFSLVNVCQFAPVLLFAITAGVVAVTLAILVATGNVQLWHVYALALGLGVVNAFDMPTRQAFVVEMVGRDDLMNGIALNSTLFNAARIVGPALAGLLLATQGLALLFAINAASYLAVIAGLLAMRLTPVATSREGTGMQRMREGLAYVRSTPSVLMPMSIVAMIAIFGMNFNVWIPLLAKSEFQTGAGGFGLLMSALGAGSLVGALTLAFSSRGPRPRLILITAAVLGLAELLLAAISSVPMHVAFALIVLPLMGFAMSTTNAMANTIVQTASPGPMRGRVMAVYMTFFAGTAPLGALLMGAIADRFGTPASVAVGGGVSLAAAVAIALLFGAWRPDAPALQFAQPGATGSMLQSAHSGNRN
jgi:predicted MFS family arabinose efflux permease